MLPKTIANSMILKTIFLLACLTGPPTVAQTADERMARTGDIVQSIHTKQKNVGLSVAVMLDGKLVYKKQLGAADLEHRVPVTANTKFQVASVTKAFTGAALLKLYSQGKVDLDADIRKYVDFPRKKEGVITVRQLAIHTSGIRHYKDGEKDLEFLNTHYSRLSDAVEAFEDDDLRWEPGSKYGYSSFGYNLLALVIEKAAGVPFDQYVAETILKPLTLSNTRFNNVRIVIPNRARNYSYFDPITYRPSEKLLRVPDFDYSYNMGGGNLLTTADDLAQFGQAFSGPGFFTDAELRMIFTSESEISPWSFGWFLSDSDIGSGKKIHVTGAFSGAQAGLYVFPESRLSIAVLSNTWGIGSNSAEMVVKVPLEIAEIWK